MKKLLAVLAVLSIAMPVLAATDYFPVTADGSFNITRGSEGYTNNGSQGQPRLSKANQNSGWMSFTGTVGDSSGLSLGAFLAANPGAQVTLHFRTSGTGSNASRILLESIRSGNQGALVGDQGGGVSNTNPATGFAGASEPVAFRGAPVPVGGFAVYGTGIYTGNMEANGGGEAWISPSTCLPNQGQTPYQHGPNTKIQYDFAGEGAPIGLIKGYWPDGTAGHNYFALEDLLGLRANNGTASGGAAQVYNAGQILVGGQANPTLFRDNDPLFAGTDPRMGTTDPNWKAIVLDSAFALDIANNPEHKGIFFTSKISGLGVDDWTNFSYFSKDQAGGAWMPYLEVTPEPATMVLLALGGLVALRRRSA